MQRAIRYIRGTTPRTRLWIAYFLVMGIGFTIFTRLANSLNAIFLLPAELIMAAFAARRGLFRRDVPMLLGVAAILWGLVASALNGGLLTEANAVAHWGMAAAWLFALRTTEDTDIDGEFTAIGTVLLVCYLPFVLGALFSVFSGIAIDVPAYDYPLGLEASGHIMSRIRVMANPNVCARTAVLSILFAIYLFGKKKRLPWRIFCGACIVLNTLVVVHAQSRGCIIGLGAAMAVVAFRAAYTHISHRALRVVAGIAACALAFGIVIYGTNLIFDADVAIAKKTAVIVTEETAEDSYMDSAGQFNVGSSGRTDIWKRTVEYLLKNPKELLFGMNTSRPMAKIAPDDEFLSQELHVHNVLLDCVVNLGLGYLLIVLAFLVYMVPKCLRVLTGARGSAYIFVAMIVALLTMGMVEVMLFARFKIENTLFMCLCGYVIRLGERRKLA